MTNEEMVDQTIQQTIERLNDLKPKLLKHLDKVQNQDWFEKGDIVYFPHRVRDTRNGTTIMRLAMGLVINPGTKKFWHDSTFRCCNQQKNVIVQVLSVSEPKFKNIVPLKISKVFGFYYGYASPGTTTKIWTYNPRARSNSWRSSNWYEKEIVPLLVKNE